MKFITITIPFITLFCIILVFAFDSIRVAMAQVVECFPFNLHIVFDNCVEQPERITFSISTFLTECIKTKVGLIYSKSTQTVMHAYYISSVRAL